MADSISPDNSARVNRFTLLLLVIVFGAPLLLGWLFYLNPEWLPAASRVRGTLIEPPRTVTRLQLRAANGRLFDWRALADRWSIFAFGQGGCAEACTTLVAKIGRIRRALGADRLRTQAVLVLLPDEEGAIDRRAPASGQGLLRLEADGETAREILRLFELHADETERLFVVDTRGDLMMSYDMERHTEKDVVKDLEVMLKASANWHAKR